MNNPSENELLSAYLDGELTAEERSRVERLLAGDPAAKQLLDELRTLKAAVQSLPREGVGEDLSSNIFRIAQQRKLNEGSANDSDGNSPSEPARPRLPMTRQIAERVKHNPRMIVWPAIVIATAVLLAIFNPEQPQPGGGNREVARVSNNQNAAQKNSGSDMTIKAAPSDPDAPDPALFAAKDANPNGKQTSPGAKPETSLFVIECETSRKALDLTDFRKMLSAHEIAYSEAAAGEASIMTSAELAEAAGIVRDLEAEKSAAQGIVRLEVIFVEATPAQMGMMINDLKAAREEFQAVSIKAPTSRRPTSTKGDVPISTPEGEKTVSRAQRVPRTALIAPSTAERTKEPAVPRTQRALFLLYSIEK